MNRAVDNSLAGKVVLVTRPLHQQAKFIQLLQQSGAEALSFPSIEIQSIAINQQLTDILSKINDYELLVFVSANALKHAIDHLQVLGITVNSIQSKVAVIGSATCEAASKAGFKVSIQPELGSNSKALLLHRSMQAEQINGRSILIVRGEGGLEDLAQGLKQRGAKVSYAEVYRRCIPDIDGTITRQQLSQDWNHFGISNVTVTSNEALNNLYEMLDSPGRDAMLKAELIVPSQRCYELAEALGFESITLASSAANMQMLEAINKVSAGT